MKQAGIVAFAVVVALGGGVAVGAVAFGGDDDGGDAATTTTTEAPSENEDTSPTTSATGSTLPELPATTVPEEGLDGAALELAQAINRAHQLSYHIVLRSVDPESPTEIELWRRLPQARRDAHLGEADAQLFTSEFRSPERGHIGCLVDTSGTGQTTCLQAPPGSVDPADPTIGAVDPSAGAVTATDERLGDIAVRCFSVAVGDGPHLACFDSEGIPAIIDGGDGRLERIGEVERGVPDDVFVPPDASVLPTDTTGTTAPGGTQP
jgi:hypothetical protein